MAYCAANYTRGSQFKKQQKNKMIFLTKPSEQSFKILLIASEIIIPLIVFIGAYYIMKPVFGKSDEEIEADRKEREAMNVESEPDKED